MASGFGEPMSPYSSNKGSNNNNGGFECNICFELAEEPIMTLCGHLYCWPCLYKWLHMNSHSHECLVCKALIEEEKLVPIYGRGKTSSDNPRCRSISGVDIPNRPAGQRPQTAPSPPPTLNYMHHGVDGLNGGFMPMAIGGGGGGNLTTMSAAAPGGLIPLLNLQVSGLNYTNVYGAPTVSPYWFPGPFHGGHFHGGHFHGFHRLSNQGRRQSDYSMKMWFLFVVLAVIFYLITS